MTAFLDLALLPQALLAVHPLHFRDVHCNHSTPLWSFQLSKHTFELQSLWSNPNTPLRRSQSFGSLCYWSAWASYCLFPPPASSAFYRKSHLPLYTIRQTSREAQITSRVTHPLLIPLQPQSLGISDPPWCSAEAEQSAAPTACLGTCRRHSNTSPITFYQWFMLYIHFPWQELTQVRITYSQPIRDPALSNVLVHSQSVLLTASKLPTVLHLCSASLQLNFNS